MTEPVAEPFSAEDFRRRVIGWGDDGFREDTGDHLLNPDMRNLIVAAELRDAAVLIPVVDHAAGASVILTKRSENLARHSGQVAFPGGRVDDTDRSVEDAALREAEEEIGLDRDFVDVLGRMPDYITGSGFRIAPVLAIVRPGFLLTINEDEVEDIFEVPLEFLMQPVNHRRESRSWNDHERFFYSMPFGDRFIWGATAGIIRLLYERLYA